MADTGHLPEAAAHPATSDWYPDPAKHYLRRYWNGRRWTADVQTADGRQLVDAAWPVARSGFRTDGTGKTGHHDTEIELEFVRAALAEHLIAADAAGRLRSLAGWRDWARTLPTPAAVGLAPATPPTRSAPTPAASTSARPATAGPATVPAPAERPQVETTSTPAPIARPRPVRTGPSRWESFSASVRTDLAVNGLAYLGVLLLFAGIFGLVVFAFGDVTPMVRPVAELLIPVSVFAAAWMLARRGAHQVSRALVVAGGLLTPLVVLASLLDGVDLPPDPGDVLRPWVLAAAMGLVSLAYALWTRRQPTSPLAALVAPTAWVAVAMGALALETQVPGGSDIGTPRPMQTAAALVAAAVSFLLARAWVARAADDEDVDLVRPVSSATLRTGPVSLGIAAALAVLSWLPAAARELPTTQTSWALLATGLGGAVAVTCLRGRIWPALEVPGALTGLVVATAGVAGLVPPEWALVGLVVVVLLYGEWRASSERALASLVLVTAAAATPAVWLPGEPWPGVVVLAFIALWAAASMWREKGLLDAAHVPGLAPVLVCLAPAAAMLPLVQATDGPHAVAAASAVVALVAVLLARRPQTFAAAWVVGAGWLLMAAAGSLVVVPDRTDAGGWSLVLAALLVAVTGVVSGGVGPVPVRERVVRTGFALAVAAWASTLLLPTLLAWVVPVVAGIAGLVVVKVSVWGRAASADVRWGLGLLGLLLGAASLGLAGLAPTAHPDAAAWGIPLLLASVAWLLTGLFGETPAQARLHAPLGASIQRVRPGDQPFWWVPAALSAVLILGAAWTMMSVSAAACAVAVGLVAPALAALTRLPGAPRTSETLAVAVPVAVVAAFPLHPTWAAAAGAALAACSPLLLARGLRWFVTQAVGWCLGLLAIATAALAYGLAPSTTWILVGAIGAAGFLAAAGMDRLAVAGRLARRAGAALAVVALPASAAGLVATALGADPRTFAALAAGTAASAVASGILIRFGTAGGIAAGLLAWAVLLQPEAMAHPLPYVLLLLAVVPAAVAVLCRWLPDGTACPTGFSWLTRWEPGLLLVSASLAATAAGLALSAPNPVRDVTIGLAGTALLAVAVAMRWLPGRLGAVAVGYLMILGACVDAGGWIQTAAFGVSALLAAAAGALAGDDVVQATQPDRRVLVPAAAGRPTRITAVGFLLATVISGCFAAGVAPATAPWWVLLLGAFALGAVVVLWAVEGRSLTVTRWVEPLLLLALAAPVTALIMCGDDPSAWWTRTAALSLLTLLAAAVGTLTPLAEPKDPDAAEVSDESSPVGTAISWWPLLPEVAGRPARALAALGLVAARSAACVAEGATLTRSSVIFNVLGAAAVVGAAVLWARFPGSRAASRWVEPLLLTAGTSILGALAIGIMDEPTHALLVPAFTVAAIEAAVLAQVRDLLWLRLLSPLLLFAAWATWCAGTLQRQEADWYTVPLGACLLVIVALLRADRRHRGGADLGASDVVVLELSGIGLLVAMSFVRALSEAPGWALVPMGVGIVTGVVGVLTHVRRRLAVGAALVLSGVLLLLVPPLLDLVPRMQGSALWIAIAVLGLVVLGVAAFFDAARELVATTRARLREATAGWE